MTQTDLIRNRTMPGPNGRDVKVDGFDFSGCRPRAIVHDVETGSATTIPLSFLLDAVADLND